MAGTKETSGSATNFWNPTVDEEIIDPRLSTQKHHCPVWK
jgi:hypothetical protein